METLSNRSLQSIIQILLKKNLITLEEQTQLFQLNLKIARLGIKDDNDACLRWCSLQQEIFEPITRRVMNWDSNKESHGEDGNQFNELPWDLCEYQILILAKMICIDEDAEVYAYESITKLVLSKEPRARQLASKALIGPLISTRGFTFVKTMIEFLLEDIRRHMYSRDVHYKQAVLGQANEVVSVDDDVGWNTLETSMFSIKMLISNLPPDIEIPTTLISQENLELLVKASSCHRSRHIKQAGLEIAAALVQSDLVHSVKDDNCDKDYNINIIRDATVRCLDDNWTQVRYSGCITARALLMKYKDKETCLRHQLYQTLLPRICMNRFYVADGVRNHAQQTWESTMGMEGKNNICLVIKDVVDHYTHASSAANHMVAEAACAAIGEIVSKLPIDTITPHMKTLFDSVLICLNSDSWPIRDSACVPMGRILQHVSTVHAEKDQVIGEDFNRVLELLTVHLQDSIYSIRQHAAEALACILRSQCTYVAQSAYRVVHEHLNQHLLRALQQGEKERTKLQFIPPSLFANMTLSSSSSSSSSSAATNKSYRQTASKWGCGLDCAVGLDCNAERISGVCDWEASEGCIYMVKELLQIYPGDFNKVWNDVYQLSNVSNFKEYHRLRTTFYAQLPEIFSCIDKVDKKKGLCEELICRMAMDITSSRSVISDYDGASNLMTEEAALCFKRLCDQMGSTVVYSRIPDEALRGLVARKLSVDTW